MLKNIIYMIKKLYPMCIKADKKCFSFVVITTLLYGLLQAVDILTTQFFFDGLYNATTLNMVIVPFIVFLGIKIFKDISDALLNYAHDKQYYIIIGYLKSKIHIKSNQISPISYEDPSRLDDINKALNGPDAVFQFYSIITFIAFFHLPYFIFTGFYLFSLKPLLVLTLLFVFIPVLISHILRSSVFSDAEDQAAPIRREKRAYSSAACGKDFIKETRMLGSFAFFKTLVTNMIDSLNKVIWKAEKRSAMIELFLNTLTLSGYGGILFLLVKYLLDGEISVGAFAAVYSSIDGFFSMMDDLINWRMKNFSNQFGQIRNFLRFLDIPIEKRKKVELNTADNINLENVNFTYPNNKTATLKNINLNIKNGETIVIVGDNGAGKTTLVKILTGLYVPTQGTVKIGSTDLSTASYKSLYKNVSGVFQKFQRYAFSLKENVQISDVSVSDDGEKVYNVLDYMHIDKDNIELFPYGLDTMLSREFNGVELSGGQWQRVAIARGLFKESDIIILDEPTSAIDPIEEDAIYNVFASVSKNKTTLIATHRLGLAKLADRIIVMSDGEIIETGTHDELMGYNSTYSSMFNTQAIWYNK